MTDQPSTQATMNVEDARRVAGIVAGADGGCYHCAAQLAGDLNKAFPDFDWFELVATAEGYWSREQLADVYLG